MDVRAQLEEASGHRFAEAGTAARDKNVSACKKLFAEHGSVPKVSVLVNGWNGLKPYEAFV
jgi:hypothetical protein